MLAKLTTIVHDCSGYKLAGVVLTLLVLTSCSDYLEDYAEQSPTVAKQSAPFQWTRSQDIETRAMFVRNHGLGYSYNAVRGEYSKWEDIRCQVVDRFALEKYCKDTKSNFVVFDKKTYSSDKSSFKYSLRDYVASVNMHLDEEVDLGLYSNRSVPTSTSSRTASRRRSTTRPASSTSLARANWPILTCWTALGMIMRNSC